VLLNPNRNAGITKDDYARCFPACWVAPEILWLDQGLPNDDTDVTSITSPVFFRDDGILTVYAARCVDDDAAKILRHNHLEIDEWETPMKSVFKLKSCLCRIRR